MRSPLRRLTGAVLTSLLAVGVLVSASSPASAITGGTFDKDNTYSGVAMIAFYDADGRFRCTATLVTPTVLLTAAHCTDGTLGKTAVIFDRFIAEQAPSGLPVAANPAIGYTSADLVGTNYLSGTAYAHPEYSNFTDLANWNDVGVIVLDQAYSAGAVTPIAPVGTLDALRQRTFTKTLFTQVGYGTEVRKPETGAQKPTPMSYPLRRQYVSSPGQKLATQVFQVNGNPNDPFGGGGTCFGDSGGPALLNGAIVGVTSYSYTANCRYLGGYQRTDIDVVRSWLAAFGVVY